MLQTSMKDYRLGKCSETYLLCEFLLYSQLIMPLSKRKASYFLTYFYN